MQQIRSKNRNLSLRRMRVISEVLEQRYLLSGAVTPSMADVAIPDPINVIGSPSATPATLSSTPTANITPAKMRSAYGLGTYNASNVTFNGVQGDGTGQTIAIYEGGDDPTVISDLTAFDSYWKLPDPPSFKVLNDTGGTTLDSPGDEEETALDVEWAHVMAPGASLVIYEGGIATAVETAKAAAGVSVITISYTSTTNYYESDFATPSGHNGVTTLSSAGDTAGEVKYPANEYEVMAVGGSDLYLNGSTYSSETAWSSGGGGITPTTQPAYQNGVVSAWSTTYRTTPDVAIDADPGTGVSVYCQYLNGSSTPWNEDEGGTSLSSPLMAGIIAVADQGRVAAGLTSMDGYTQTLPRIYSLPSSNFHDITTGNNGNAAGVGYDLASGLGSPIANKFIPDLAGAATVTGRVFQDVSGNGIYDGSDTPIVGKTVYLDINNDGIAESNEPTAVTNSTGIYTFSDQIGSETGTVRLASPPAGELHTTTAATFTTSYDTTQTVNIGYYTTNYVAAAASTVTTTTTGLSVTGTSPSNAASFLYTWAATTVPTGATTPTFAPNGTNAAKASTVTFYKAGSYVFTLTISDGQGGSVTSTVSVVVNQTLTSIVVTSAASSVFDAGTVQVSAVANDQFGAALTTQPKLTWSIDNGGVGSVSTTGLYTAPAAGPGTAAVRATSGAISSSATITVILSVVDGTSGDDTIRLVRSASNLLVYLNNSVTPLYNVSYGTLSTLLVASGTGVDTINIDFSGGATPVPSGGLSVNGGGDTDSLIVTGTTGNDTASINSATVTMNGSTFSYSGIESIAVNGNGGTDSLTQVAQPGNLATLAFNGVTSGGPSKTDSLNVNAGSYAFAAPASGSKLQPILLASLNIASGAVVSVGTATARTDRWALTLGALNLTNGGDLDLGGNDMIVHNGVLGTLFSEVQSAAAGGKWNGLGISSTAAQTEADHLTALGIIANTYNGSGAIYNTFDNQPAAYTDVLIKYTYYGDATLNGQVDGSDYSKIDYGNLVGLTGWSNGDFNYDGVVNSTDYTLIDNAFNTQNSPIPSAVVASDATTASTASVVTSKSKAAGTVAAYTPAAAGLFSTTQMNRPLDLTNSAPADAATDLVTDMGSWTSARHRRPFGFSKSIQQ